MSSEAKYGGEEIGFEAKSYDYWSEKFNCEKRDLMEAVFKVGNQVHVVLAYLEMNGKIKES